MEGATSPARRSRAVRLLVPTAVIAAGVVLLAACGSSGQTPAASTEPVQRATITTGVSAAGTLAASS